MAGSIVYVAWQNSTGVITFSVRKPTGHSLPPSSTESAPTLISLQIPAPEWANIAYSIIRPIRESITTLSATSNYIYAYSSRMPSDIDASQSPFTYHDSFGSISNIDFTTLISQNEAANEGGSINSGPKAILQLPDNMTYESVLYIHGFLMIIAWGIAAPLG